MPTATTLSTRELTAIESTLGLAPELVSSIPINTLRALIERTENEVLIQAVRAGLSARIATEYLRALRQQPTAGVPIPEPSGNVLLEYRASWTNACRAIAALSRILHLREREAIEPPLKAKIAARLRRLPQTNSRWRERARRALNNALSELPPAASEAQVKTALRLAYDYHPRRGYPYKTFLCERAWILGRTLVQDRRRYRRSSDIMPSMRPWAISKGVAMPD